MVLTEGTSDVQIIDAEVVAKTIAGIEQVGVAQRALEDEGWLVQVAGRRITVNGCIEAVLLSARESVWWQVFAVDGTPPIWTVGCCVDSVSSWMGCMDQ